MITCVIIDDEPLAGQLLSSYVEKIEDLELLDTFSNPLEALSFFGEKEADLIFLDVQMPELNGVQLAKIIGEKSKVIFTTAYPNYAVEGFELNAVDYLVKPITLERFLKAVNRVKGAIHIAENATPAPALKSGSDYIFVKTEYRHQKINFSDILFFKGLGDYVAIHTHQEKILTLENMKDFEQSLPQDKFMRVHKSFIVSLDKIEFIEKNRVVIQKEYIPISATYQKAFWDKIG